MDFHRGCWHPHKLESVTFHIGIPVMQMDGDVRSLDYQNFSALFLCFSFNIENQTLGLRNYFTRLSQISRKKNYIKIYNIKYCKSN